MRDFSSARHRRFARQFSAIFGNEAENARSRHDLPIGDSASFAE
jgi:hypothetical protein